MINEHKYFDTIVTPWAVLSFQPCIQGSFVKTQHTILCPYPLCYSLSVKWTTTATIDLPDTTATINLLATTVTILPPLSSRHTTTVTINLLTTTVNVPTIVLAPHLVQTTIIILISHHPIVVTTVDIYIPFIYGCCGGCKHASRDESENECSTVRRNLTGEGVEAEYGCERDQRFKERVWGLQKRARKRKRERK